MAQREKICLIVENNEFERSRMRRVLSNICPQGTVVIAKTAEEAWKRLQQKEVAVMFLENELPDGRGAELAMRMAQDKRHAGTSVILFEDNPTPFMYAKADASQNVRAIWTKRQFNNYTARAALAKHSPSLVA